MVRVPFWRWRECCNLQKEIHNLTVWLPVSFWCYSGLLLEQEALGAASSGAALGGRVSPGTGG